MKRLFILTLVAHLCLGAILSSASGRQVLSCNHRRRSETTDDENEYCDAKQHDRQGNSSATKENCLRVAVVDYSRVDGTNCNLTVGKNLELHEKIVRLAKENGAQMVLLPEDGILYGKAEEVLPCLEDIPDPQKLPDEYNPCLEQDRFHHHYPILTRLSCLAKQNQIYLIANFGTKQRKTTKCDITYSDDCEEAPINDFLVLNTDVIFEPTGRFIGRYRKWNPFTETEMFDKAPELEHVYFDTQYGRFGVFTCFDIIFREPAIELLDRYKIDTALFPTWWFDELPLLTAVQYQDAWSAANQVNMLSANILKPSRGSLGSSIFSRNNSVYVTPNNVNRSSGGQVSRKTQILLGTIDTRPRGTDTCQRGFEPKIIEIDDNATNDEYTYKNFRLHADDAVKRFHKPAGTITACSGMICCRVDYELQQSIGDDHKRLIVIARDAPRLGFYQWYEQICAVVTLKEPYKPPRPGSDQSLMSETLVVYDTETSVSFEKLSIEATFATKYVYPTTAHSLSRLLDRSRRSLLCDAGKSSDENHCKLEFVPSDRDSNKLYSFALYGRVYEKDRHN